MVRGCRAWTSEVGTPSPTHAEWGCPWLTSRVQGPGHASSGPGCFGHPKPWTRLGLCREGGWGWDGGPAPQLAGSTASLGSRSQRDSWLSTRFELTEPADSNQMFLLFPNQGREWGEPAPGFASLLPRANKEVKIGLASLWPEPTPGWLGRGGWSVGP